MILFFCQYSLIIEKTIRKIKKKKVFNWNEIPDRKVVYRYKKNYTSQ